MDRRTFLTAGTSFAGLAALHPAAQASSRAQTATRPQVVSVSDFGSDDDAIRNAINTAAREVVVDIDVAISSDVLLRSNQKLRFAGGRIIVAKSAAIENAVLYNIGGKQIDLIDPIVDASASTVGVTGIGLLNVTGIRINGGHLIRANLKLESGDNTVWRAADIAHLTIDMSGYAATAIYLSGIRGVDIRDSECFGGHEGIGIYNAARRIKLSGVASHHHAQDGFLVNAGHEILHIKCQADNNRQSGFTTQRQTSGNDSQYISWVGCLASGNDYDGFDIRGANTTPWHVDTNFGLSACIARSNTGCGFNIVNAEGTALKGCAGIQNRQQNLLIHTSDRVVADHFRSSSGASAAASGPNKAGILIYNSNAVHLDAPSSGNEGLESQEYGVAFTGTSTGGRVAGGDLSKNSAGSFFTGSKANVETVHEPTRS